MIKRVIALSYSAMKELIREHPEMLARHGFISIIDNLGSRIFDRDTPRVVTVVFDDVRPDTVAQIMGDRAYTVFDENHAHKIIEFISALNENPDAETLYVNCGAGISRSGAVVTFVQQLYELDQERFATDNQGIIPNTWVLQTLHGCWQKRKSGGGASAPPATQS